MDINNLAITGALVRLGEIESELNGLRNIIGEMKARNGDWTSTEATPSSPRTMGSKPHWTQDKAKLAAANRRRAKTRRENAS